MSKSEIATAKQEIKELKEIATAPNENDKEEKPQYRLKSSVTVSLPGDEGDIAHLAMLAKTSVVASMFFEKRVAEMEEEIAQEENNPEVSEENKNKPLDAATVADLKSSKTK